ncbi:MAG TPA: efflux RND transporter permease subunit [Vicinamibacteria bacterium]|nr:efflux RND transporter permease subunit [Vicinamibacteria bacterium]
MFLSNLSIRHPVFATMMMAALAVLGVASYSQLKVDMFPKVEIPVVTVTTIYPGAGPETVEREVTKKIEEEINTVEGVKHIESISQEGLSNIVVEFQLEVSAINASQDVRGKIAAIRGDLPREIEEPIVQRIDFGQLPVLSIGVDAPGLSPQAATTFADKVVKKRLESVRGVGAVALVGESTREIQVVVDRLKLEAYHVSLNEVVLALQRENVDVPAGNADRGSTEALVRVAARGRTPEDIGRIPVKRPGGMPVYVSDLAQVIDGIEEPRNAAFLDERPALALEIQKQSGANTVSVADAVLAALEKLKRDMPPGITLSVIKDDSGFIRDSIEDVNTTMIIGGLLTVFIVYLFLNSWRSTIITGVTLPISVVSGFIAMRAFGFTLNVITLMGLSLAIGMLIDDAIVVRENIVRHLQRGKDHFDAARDGTAEIGLAVMATTFTILAVFVPVSFMSGMVGRFFYEFGITVAAAVVASLFVSFTLDPMLSSRWVDPDIEKGYHPHLVGRTLQAFNQWFEDMHVQYERLLGWALRHRPAVLAIAAAAFLLAFPILAILGGDFMPDFNRGEYQVTFKATPGATLAETKERALAVVRELKRLPDVDYTYTTIGESGITRRGPTEGVVYVKLKSSRGKTFTQVLSDARRAVAVVPGLTYGFTEAGPFGQKPLQYSVRGPEVDELDRLSRELAGEMAKIPNLVDVETSLEKTKPELRVHFDRDRAGDLGLNVGPVAMTLRAAVTGDVATTIEDAAGDSHDVRVRLRADQRRYATDLLALRVPTDKDDAWGDKILVPLSEVATATPASGPSTIRHKDLQREVRLSAANSKRSVGELMGDVNAAIARMQLPPGYDVMPGGDAEELVSMFKSMLQTLALAVIFIYLILASQFGSFFHPFAIMLSLPLSLVGVAVALLATRDTLNMMSMIGLIMLMGLVTKNAILLVDFTNQAREKGVPRDQALIKAGSTRLRPIVMTTLAMIFGMLPLAFAIGAGAELRAPMARAVIGGLVTSTMLTLVVVPVVYTYLDGLRPEAVREWLAARRRRRTEARAPAPEGAVPLGE